MGQMLNKNSSKTCPKSRNRLKRTMLNYNKSSSNEPIPSKPRYTNSKLNNTTRHSKSKFQTGSYNITHSRFPKKYKNLFNQTRKQFIESYRNPNDKDSITTELETIYGYIKQQILQAKNPKEITANARLAHTILKQLAHTPNVNTYIDLTGRSFINLLVEDFPKPDLFFFTNIGAAYLINSTLKHQTHNHGNLLILKILVQTKKDFTKLTPMVQYFTHAYETKMLNFLVVFYKIYPISY